MARLPLSFYQQPTVKVARELLGKVLVHAMKDGTRLSGVITETEAYLGTEDAAAHSYRGRRTARTEPMYLSGGHAYVYFIYGMHECFNVVTAEKGNPQAVLIRALEPLEGIKCMEKFRRRKTDLTNGPGKLCQALQITRAFNRHRLDKTPLWIESPRQAMRPRKMHRGPRIGVAYAGEAATWPLRFWLDRVGFN